VIQDIPEFVLGNPALLVALTAVILALAQWQRTLTYREYRLAHTVKLVLFNALDDWASRRGRPLVRTKGYREDAEFVQTLHQPPRSVYQQLAGAFDPHLIATAKARTTPDGRQWSHSQLVTYHDDGKQTEVFLFDNGDGSTDLYAHFEGSVSDPAAHLTDPQRDGDVRGVLNEVLDEDA